MKTRDLVAIGIPAGACAERAKQLLQEAHTAKRSMAIVLDDLKRLALSPGTFVDDERYGELAQQLLDQIAAGGRFQARESDAPYRIWGSDLEPEAVKQMKNACKLPGRRLRGADAGCACRVWPANWRRTGHKRCRHPVRRRCGYRLPDEAVGA